MANRGEVRTAESEVGQHLAEAIDQWLQPAPTLAPIVAADLPGHLRALMSEDGTVTNLLTALSGEQVAAQPVAWPEGARWSLAKGAGADRVLERHIVLMGQKSGQCYCFASSLLMLDRLPPDFLSVLRGTPAGIGAALRTLGFETRREFAWQGFLPAAPVAEAFKAGFPDGALCRAYRIIRGGLPIVVIRETFPATLSLPQWA